MSSGANVRLGAHLMAGATEDEWSRFIGLLGGDGAARLLAAIDKARPAIDRHKAALAGEVKP
jgi:muramoyltetrapeptide carboxypeptidase LdcA involved in peptidoglycan recycling